MIYGNAQPLIANLAGILAVSAYTAVVTFIILKVINAITPIRVTFDEEKSGLDSTQHNEMINTGIVFPNSKDSEQQTNAA